MTPLSALQQMMHASPPQFSLYCLTALLERNRRFSRPASESGCTTAVLLLMGSGKSGSTGSGLSAMPSGSVGSGPNSCPCSPASSPLYTGLVYVLQCHHVLLLGQCSIGHGHMGVDNNSTETSAAASALSALCSAQALTVLTTCRSGLVVVGGAFDSSGEAWNCGNGCL